MRLDIYDFVDFHFYETTKFYRATSYPAIVASFEKWPGLSKNVGLSL